MLDVEKIQFFDYGVPLHYNFKAPSGSLTLISGPSGQGKTTLLSIIAGFRQPQMGRILFNNQDLTPIEVPKRPISILFQDHNLFPHMSARDNIGLGLNSSLKLTSEDKEKIDDIAYTLGIHHVLDQYPEELSGGQKQRVSLARVLLRKRPLLLLDEPFVGLDQAHIEKSLSAIQKQKERYNLTVLLVSHQYEYVSQHADQVILI